MAKLLLIDYSVLIGIQKIISYHSFEIAKKGTAEKRPITAPSEQLKVVQKRILRLLQPIKRRNWLISGEKGKSYIDNGKAHIIGKYALTIDIRKFYDNCIREPVYHFFTEKLMVSPDAAKLLSDIVTYNRGIPTGCPTSQIIAYYAYADMFDEIADLAVNYSCVFTLYVDDMTFSSQYSFDKDKLCLEIDRTLRKYGHKPKYKKIKYYSKNDAKPITGTIVTSDNRLDVPNGLQEKVFNRFIGIKKQLSVSDASFDTEIAEEITKLRGQLQAVQNIVPNKFSEIKRVMTQAQKEITAGRLSG